MKKLKDMLEEKDGKDNGDMEKDAKLSALRELRDIVSKAMGNGMKSKMDGVQKVTVASDDKDGLVKGLEKAKDMMKEMPSNDKEEEESPEEEDSEMDMDDEMSAEDIDSMIKKLQEKKAQLSK